MAATLAGQPYAPEAVPQDEASSSCSTTTGTTRSPIARTRCSGATCPGRRRCASSILAATSRRRSDRVLEDGTAREILFSRDLFDMPRDNPARQTGKCRLRRLRGVDPDGKNDWMAVLGASYFRTSGYSGQFGMSARGLAIDSGGRGAEEFPRFTRFWLEEAPEGGIVIYALLESPRATGAYRMATAPQERGVPGHRGGAVPARAGDRPAGDRAADLDVLVRQEQPFRRAGLAAGDPRQRRAGDGSSAPASGSGGR